MEITGRVLKYGDNINTDLIIPSKYLVFLAPQELAKHAMAGIDEDFPRKVEEGKILVAEKNFGSGSSREQAPVALKYAGVKCILADSFARIFYRNAINIGLPVIEYEGISQMVSNDDELLINLEKGTIENVSKHTRLQMNPIPEFLLQIMERGLVEYMRGKDETL